MLIRKFSLPIISLKDVGPPTRYLGAKIGEYQLANGHETWYTSAGEDYLAKAIPVIKESYGPLKPLFKAKLDSPALPDYHPELGKSDFLSNTETILYQSYIGFYDGPLNWAVLTLHTQDPPSPLSWQPLVKVIWWLYYAFLHIFENISPIICWLSYAFLHIFENISLVNWL